MGILFTRISVPYNCSGFLFHENKLHQELAPGIKEYFDPLNLYSLCIIPKHEVLLGVENQEVLAKDLVAFRFSYSVSYVVTEPRKLLESIDFGTTQILNAQYQASSKVHIESQIVIRERVAQFSSLDINSSRVELLEGCLEKLQSGLSSYGISPTKLQLRDLTFPKRIQDLFALELESKIRAKVELENARSTVAATRALKNAGELLKSDPSLQYLHYLETITKIASGGKHTFVIGEKPATIGA